MSEILPHPDTKECKSCLKEKRIQDFATYRSKSGVKAYRRTCKECKNKREKRRVSRPIESLPLFDEMPKKRCNVCFEWKQDSDFNAGKVACTACEDKKKREEKLFTKEMQRLHLRNGNLRYHARHPVAKISQRLRRQYGMSYEEYCQMVTAQNNLCAICGSLPTEGNILYVDHDHQTGAIRGLLCQKCNSLLGMANDKVDILDNAIQYLHRYAS